MIQLTCDQARSGLVLHPGYTIKITKEGLEILTEDGIILSRKPLVGEELIQLKRVKDRS